MLFCFFETDSKTYKTFEYYENGQKQDIIELKTYTEKITTSIAFNQLHYDNPMLQQFLKTKSVASCKKYSDKIIDGKVKHYDPVTHFPEEIDLLQIMDRKGSLKIFQARMGLNEIVIDDDFDKLIDNSNVNGVIKYCKNDVYATYELYQKKEVQAKIEVKRNIANQFGLPLFSLTESDIAEQIFRKEFNYRVQNLEAFINVGNLISSKVNFLEDVNKSLLENYKKFSFKLKLTPNNRLVQSKKFSKIIELGNLKYKAALGGLHSDKTIKGAYVAGENDILWHIDVSSYYPNTVKNLELYPQDRKDKFRELYCGMIEERNKAKANKDKAKDKALKIVLNASFGRFKFKNSCLYDAKMLYNITINCQLFMIMLVEQFHRANIDILYVNTDGIVIRTSKDRESDVNKVIEWWENKLDYKLDKDDLQAAFIKDTNNRLFLGKNGKVIQSKGAAFINEYTLFHNKKSSVAAAKAVHNYYLHGVPVRETIRQLTDWQNFVVFQQRKPTKTKEVETTLFDDVDQTPLEKEERKKLYRYYISNDPTKAKRVKGICSKPIIEAYNIKRDFDLSLVDLSYYENEAQKIIDTLTPPEPPKDDDSLFSLFDKPRKPQEGTLSKNSTAISKTQSSTPVGIFPLDKLAMEKSKLQDVMELLLDKGLYIAHKGKSYTLRKPRNYRTYIEYPQQIPDDLSWICLNPFRPGTTEKSKKYIANRNCITIEYDNKSLSEQLELMKRVPHTVIVYSGNKSLHCHIRFTRPLTNDENAKLDEYMLALFGDSDHSTWKTNQYVRMPFGINYDTGKNQDVISVQKRVDPSALFSWLEKERKTKGVELVTDKMKLLSPQAPNKPYVTYCTYSLMQQRPDFKMDISSDQITLTGKCPQGHLHKSGINNDDSFYINIKKNGQIYKYCHHDSCSDIHTKQFKNLGIRLKSREMLQKFYKTDEFKNLNMSATEFQMYLGNAPTEPKDTTKTSEQKMIETLESIEVDEKYKVSEILNKLMTIEEKETYILTLPTGTGKTYSMLLACKHLVEKRGETIVFVCGTKNEAYRAIQILKGLDVPIRDIELFVSDQTSNGDDLEQSSATDEKEKAPYKVTTYGYFGRKGHTQQIYTGFMKRIESSYVFFDECQTMINNSEVSENLTAMYRNHKGEYYKTNDFSLEKDYILANKKRKEISANNVRHFHKDFLQKSKHEYIVDTNYQVFSKSEVLETEGFAQASGTVFVKATSDIGAQKPEVIDASDKTLDTYIKSLCNDLQYLHLRTELPLWKETGEALTYKELQQRKQECIEQNGNLSKLKDKIQFPKQTPFVTSICGIDRLGFWQLSGMTVKIKPESGGETTKSYKKPKGLVFSSATVPPMLKEILQETLGDTFNMKTIGSDNPPCTFDVTLLKTNKSISLNNLQDLVPQILNKKEKAFIVCSTKHQARALFNRTAHITGVGLFDGTDYIRECKKENTERGIDVIITYANSAICKGENLKDYQIAIVDASIFMPSCALTVREDKNQQEIKAALYQNIQQKLTQTCGRLLRTNKEIIEDQTIQDDRKICILLHSLPPEIEHFTIDEKLTHKITEHSDLSNWFDKNKSKFTESIMENITNITLGKGLVNYENEKSDQQYKKKLQKLENEAKSFIKKGLRLRDFQRSVSLHKKKWIKKSDKENIAQMFGIK